jgi:hypothetical protein
MGVLAFKIGPKFDEWRTHAAVTEASRLPPSSSEGDGMIAIAGRSSFVIARIVFAQPGIVIRIIQIERGRVMGRTGAAAAGVGALVVPTPIRR